MKPPRRIVREACELPGVDAIPELVLASMYDQAKKLKECEQWYRRGLDLPPDAANAVRLKFSRWLIHNNGAAEAKDVITKARAPEGRFAEYAFVAGLATRMLGDIEAAGKIFNRLHTEDPGNYSVSNQLALVMIETDDKENHENSLKIAIANAQRMPQSAELLATLGWVQFRVGDLEKAEKSLNLAVRQGQKSRDTLYYLSQLKAAQGKEKEAELFKTSLPTESRRVF